MSDYKKAGVDIKMGDKASKIAYSFARSTFSSRKNMIGEPVLRIQIQKMLDSKRLEKVDKIDVIENIKKGKP